VINKKQHHPHDEQQGLISMVEKREKCHGV